MIIHSEMVLGLGDANLNGFPWIELFLVIQKILRNTSITITLTCPLCSLIGVAAYCCHLHDQFINLITVLAPGLCFCSAYLFFVTKYVVVKYVNWAPISLSLSSTMSASRTVIRLWRGEGNFALISRWLQGH